MSAHESHRWRVGEPPPKIRSHTLVKHLVLETYLKRYVDAVTRNVSVRKLTLTVVDGFAGGNIYTDAATGGTRPGSPSVILDALEHAKAEAQGRRKNEFILDDYYVFVEKDRGAFEFLRQTIGDSRHKARVGDTIHLVRGDFCDQAPKLIDLVKRRAGGEHALFILDQTGYSAVPFLAIREFLSSLSKAEVFLTFAVDYLINYLGENFRPGDGAARAGIDLDQLMSKMDKSDKAWRRYIQIKLRDDIQSKTGAGFSTPFFIRSRDSNRDLWLVHLSRHYRARDVIVGVHWDQTNSVSAHYGRAGLDMLGFDPARGLPASTGGWLSGFYFDDTARELTMEATLEELPRYLAEKGSPTDVRSLFTDISNDTPATVKLLYEVLGRLLREGEIEIRDKDGLTLRRRGVQHDTDVIRRPEQARLFGRFRPK